MKCKIVIISFFGLLISCSNAEQNKSTNDTITLTEHSNVEYSNGQRLIIIQELENLRNLLLSGDKQKIATIFQFPLADTTVGVYLEDSAYNSEFTAKYPTVQPMFGGVELPVIFGQKLMTRQELRVKMQKVVEEWRGSGLSQKQWCKKRKIPYSTFHYWYKQCREQAIQITQPDNSFVQLDMETRGAELPYGELVFPDGKKLIFYQQMDAALIKVLTS